MQSDGRERPWLGTGEPPRSSKMLMTDRLLGWLYMGAIAVTSLVVVLAFASKAVSVVVGFPPAQAAPACPSCDDLRLRVESIERRLDAREAPTGGVVR